MRVPVVGLCILTSAAPLGALAPEPRPPVAPRHPHAVVSANGTRDDPYYWLRDDTHSKPEVLNYLEAENAYYAAMSAPFRGLSEALSREIIGRERQDDSTVPYKRKGYVYYTRYSTGKEYPVYARRPVGSDSEQILVDADKEAIGKDYYAVGGRAVSAGEDILAFTEDTGGRRQHTLRFREIATGRDYPDRIPGVRPSLAWANDNRTIYYVENDPITLLSTRVKKHVLGGDPKADPVVYEEKDTSFYLGVHKSGDDRFVVIVLGSTVASEWHVIDADHPAASVRTIAPRESGVLYDAGHVNGRWVIRTDLGAPNFRLMSVADAEVGDKTRWKELLPYDPGISIEGFELFNDFLAIRERSDGLLRIAVMAWGAPEKAFHLAADEPAYAENFSVNAEQDTDVLRYTYTSLTAPASVYEVNMRTGARTLLKRKPVVGYEPENYVSERAWAPARDGARIPISLVYRKGWKRDGTAPLYQYAYGSYGESTDPEFDSTVISLLDRGFVYAIAHVRGGQELGRAWYDAGKLLHKKNTFTDFVDATDFLVRERYVAADKAFASGLSAGGLLMGAVLTMAPEKYRAIVANVPFVDVVTTMLDTTIPLTSNEFDEWGNPERKAYYDYMLSYSPYDNVKAQRYCALLVTTALNDSQVQYYEPAKWVAKLRATKTDHNPLLFRINMAGGHGGRSGRFESLKETAEEYAFVLNQAGIGK